MHLSHFIHAAGKKTHLHICIFNTGEKKNDVIYSSIP